MTDAMQYIGVNDHEIDLFEGQYPVPNGMSYNSYVILDEKIAVMDTVDIHFAAEWLGNLEAALAGNTPDYLIVQHMEPDHSAAIALFCEKYPDAVVVSSAKAFAMMQLYFGTAYEARRLVVKEKDTLALGAHTLNFIEAPLVHWPEVIMTYESAEKVLFSADGFGKFGALDVEEPWDDEARRYYIGIVGKFGPQVQRVLQKAATLDIAAIAPLHGPVLTENLGHYIGLYDTWSSYTAEKKGVVIAYTSVYGHTKEAAELLAKTLQEKGEETVRLYDLARDDLAAAVADAFCFDRLVLATTTYNGDIYPFMKDYIFRLLEHNFQGRSIGLMENGSWGLTAARIMKGLFEKSKNITFLEPTVQIKAALSHESRAQLEALADVLIKS